MALALARDARLHVDVLVDERRAAFRALGIALGSGRPVALLCTSGTAAANFHPAVIEASHARVPLIVCTADRPPELRDTGAGQTIDQVQLYGSAVRWFCDPGPPEDIVDAGAVWRSLAARAVAALTSGPAAVLGLPAPALKVGQSADCVLVAPEQRWSVDTTSLLGKSKNSPLLGRSLPGRIELTLAQGCVAFDRFAEPAATRRS